MCAVPENSGNVNIICYYHSLLLSKLQSFVIPSPYNKYFQHNIPWLFFSRKIKGLLSLVGLFLDSDELGSTVSQIPAANICVCLTSLKQRCHSEYTVKKRCPHIFNHVIVIASDIKFISEWADLAKTFSIRLDSLLTSCVSFWRFASTGSWVAAGEPSERS